MLRRCNYKRLIHGAHKLSTVAGKHPYQRRIAVITALGVVVGGCTLCYKSGLIQNDVSVAPQSVKESRSAPTGSVPTQENIHESHTLHSLVWGSNVGGTLVPGASKGGPIRKPIISGWLEGVALRDLGLHEKHAACVDGRGDVYQWGDGFCGNSSSPKRTLRGKNIVQLQLTDEKIYALSASGRIYILASSAEKQVPQPGAPTPAGDAWWGTGWVWGEETTVDFTEVSPAETLSWGEKFTAITAGRNHLLGLTSAGRVFAHPVNKLANHYGQLGLRKFHMAGSTKTSSIEVELIPKSSADPYANTSRAARTTPTPFVSENVAHVNDSDIRFCTNLFEVPILRGVEAAQIATGSRTSFLRTKTGRVLAWGANDFGQLGLGSHVFLDTVVVPTEVVLWRFVSPTTENHCLSVSAGGDLTAFAVERKREDHPTTTDLLMSGNGQYGGLGNTAYLNSQGEPTRVRGISGFLQYNEIAKRLEPIKPAAISISPTGHVLVSLNSAKDSGAGNDLMFWGKNYDSESGNGKKASIAQPIVVELSEGERLTLIEKKAKEVKDLEGNVWKRGVRVQQRPVAGHQSSVVYWKIV